MKWFLSIDEFNDSLFCIFLIKIWNIIHVVESSCIWTKPREKFFVEHFWSYNIWIHIWNVFVIKIETLIKQEVQENFVSFIMYINVVVRCCYFSLSALAIKPFLYMIFKHSITSCFNTTKWMTINRTWEIDTNRLVDTCHIFITFLSDS